MDNTGDTSSYGEPTSLLARLQTRASQVLGARHWITTRIHYRWCRSLANAGAPDIARKVLLELLGLSDGERLLDAIDDLSWESSADPFSLSYGLAFLADTTWNLCYFQESIACSRKCVYLLIGNGMEQAADTLIHLGYIEDCLIQTESWAELASWREQYPVLHAKLQDETRFFKIPGYDFDMED